MSVFLPGMVELNSTDFIIKKGLYRRLTPYEAYFSLTGIVLTGMVLTSIFFTGMVLTVVLTDWHGSDCGSD